MFREISIVTYHDVSSEADVLTRQLSLTTRPETFREHLNYYNKNYDIIGEHDLLCAKLPRRPLLITFDDAYRSVFTVAAPLLKEVAAPSIFFIIPSLVVGKGLPIDNVLSLAVEELGVDRVASLVTQYGPPARSVGEMISRSIVKMKLKEIQELKEKIFGRLGTTEHKVEKEARIFLGPDDIVALKELGMAVGNHSMTHSRLRTLSLDELNEEIGESRRLLELLSHQPVRSLSVPYGDEGDATEQVVEVARSSGHEAIFLVHARSNRFRRADGGYYRVSLRNETVRELALSINVLPILRSAKGLIAA